ncbi:MAG: response regulator [Magnetococcales bacterium]|nr:response regulator [Magnetococcales bacterium]
MDILVVDDKRQNRLLLQDILEDENFIVTMAQNGREACAILEKEPDRFVTVLLDRMMPEMDGMEVLQWMKRDKRLKHIPVIFQTALAQTHEVVEGLQAGAFYYVTKPFPEDDILLAIVRSAIEDYKRYLLLRDELLNISTKKITSLMALKQKWQLQFKNIDDVNNITTIMAQAYPNPQRVMTGLHELLLNAVEHGNLEITYREKTLLNRKGTWAKELERRLTMPEYVDRIVDVQFTRDDKEITVIIKDQGKGFDWRPYMDFAPERAFDNHGRGIALSNHISFDRLEFLGTGSEVKAIVSLAELN